MSNPPTEETIAAQLKQVIPLASQNLYALPMYDVQHVQQI